MAAIRYSYRHPKVVELLLKDPRVDPSANNNYGTALHRYELIFFVALKMASQYNHSEVADLLKKQLGIFKHTTETLK
jgi:hypothetical protein